MAMEGEAPVVVARRPGLQGTLDRHLRNTEELGDGRPRCFLCGEAAPCGTVRLLEAALATGQATLVVAPNDA